jgi:Holliday junction resolvase
MASKQSQKGSRFEYKIRDLLRAKTGAKWERTPLSGGGTLKGDLYCLSNHYYHCFECKSFKDTVIQENLLSAKSNNIYLWWEQAVREAGEMSRIPALVFKKDRGKPIIAIQEHVEGLPHIVMNTFNMEGVHLYLFESWLEAKDAKELVLL